MLVMDAKPVRKTATLRPIHPNAGIEAAYRAKLDALIDEMQRSLVYWLKARYRANPPEMAQDASPAADLRKAMKELSRQWERRFYEAAPELAEFFAESVHTRTSAQLRQILKTHGISIKFKMSRKANDVLQAVTFENVGLIRSIAAQHLAEVEGLVMRSVTTGRDLLTLSQQLEARYGVTKRRAALIARDQNNKATAVINRVNQESVGITEAVWVHSGAGAHPRPEHLRWGQEKKRYQIADGMYSEVDGQFVWPGTAINCRCVCRSILPGA
jgi:uncharacterized protein with gpF-like domain